MRLVTVTAQFLIDLDALDTSWADDRGIALNDIGLSVLARLADEAGYAGPGGEPITPLDGSLFVRVVQLDDDGGEVVSFESCA